MTATPTPAHNPRFANFARAHGRTPAEQLAADRAEWPGGVMAGFTLWNTERLREFAKVQPLAFTCGGLTDHAAYDAWLTAYVDALPEEVEADSYSINEPPTTARPGDIVNLTRSYLIHGTDWRTHTGRSVMESGFYWITDAGAACGPFLDALDATKARDAGQNPHEYATATTGAADHV